MKILKLYPNCDTVKRYNYHINYGVWDCIEGDRASLENLNINELNKYDIVFLPMYKRWENNKNILNKIKEHKIKKVLFDNDSCYRSFNDSFYSDIDFIFYRDFDKNGDIPKSKASHLLWSIDTELYKPNYGGVGVSFNCSVTAPYELRTKIIKSGVIKKTSYNNEKYIDHLRKCAGAIHTDSIKIPYVRAKILEFAACGTEIISNKTNGMELYFPNDLIIYFDSVEHLRKIINEFKPNVETQKELRRITEIKHDNKIRAEEILNKIDEIL